MSKRYKIPPVNFQDFKAKRKEEGAIPVVMPDGDGERTFYVLPPDLLGDDQIKDFFRLEGEDPVAQARMMMEDYDDFVELGGSAMLLLTIIQETTAAIDAAQGADSGEDAASSPS